MGRTFEELATTEVDALYQGALFLCGGDPGAAEKLVVETVTLAFRDYAGEAETADVQRWFEERLVRSFLRTAREDGSGGSAPNPATTGISPSAFDALAPEALFAAAGRLPDRPRATLWLVLLKRWSYDDAAEVLGTGPKEIARHLAWRDALMHALVPADGTNRRGQVS